MRLLAAAVLLLAPAALAARDTDDWVDFSPKGGKCTVKLPGKPKDMTREIDTPGGKLKVNIWGYEEGASGAYLISYTDFPEDSVDPDDTDAFFERVQGGIVGSSKGKVTSSKNTKFQKKYPARDVKYTVPTIKGTGRVRMILIGDRLYQLMALGNDEFMESEEIDFYFNSFKLTTTGKK
jgi:hypothetical protein